MSFYTKIGKYNIKITNTKKVLFPKSKITKNELVDYYCNIAPAMLPYIKNRALTMQRFPDGIAKEGFYQKNASDYFPTWIKIKPIAKQENGKVHYVVCNNAATLVYLANQLCITPHIWLSKIDKLNYPDKMIFDLDPSAKNFTLVLKTAKRIKKVLEQVGLKTFVMTTGSRGLHVVVPLNRKETFDQVRSFAQEIATILVATHPKELTMEVRKAKRGKKVFIDTLRNAFAQTGVAPYAVRAKEKAPIATPLDWVEVNSTLRPDKFNIKNIFKRLSRKKDPWRHISKYACSLAKARKQLSRFYNS